MCLIVRPCDDFTGAPVSANALIVAGSDAPLIGDRAATRRARRWNVAMRTLV
jgi:hypothetical protein